MIERVRDRATFEAFRRQARRTRRGPVTVMFLPADGPPVSVAFGISRKVGSAVVRNKVRRRLREIMRDLSRNDQLAPGSYLLVVRPEVTERSFQDLAGLVGAACAEVGK